MTVKYAWPSRSTVRGRPLNPTARWTNEDRRAVGEPHGDALSAPRRDLGRRLFLRPAEEPRLPHGESADEDRDRGRYPQCSGEHPAPRRTGLGTWSRREPDDPGRLPRRLLDPLQRSFGIPALPQRGRLDPDLAQPIHQLAALRILVDPTTQGFGLGALHLTREVAGEGIPGEPVGGEEVHGT